MPIETIPDALVGERLDRVVALIGDVSRAAASRWIADGEVIVNGSPASSRRMRLELGDVVAVPDVTPLSSSAISPDPDVDFEVVFADEHLVIVDKPADLVVHPGNGPEISTLVHGLVARFADLADVGEPGRPGIVHRLDKGTSGLLVVARTEETYTALVESMAARLVRRVYRSLVWGHLAEARGVIDAPIGRSGRDRTRMTVSADGRDARTHYERLETFDEPDALSLVECRLETGRTHQIRVHLSAIGHPVVGDAKYHGARARLELDRPFLHACELAFVHPITGEDLVFRSPLPPALTAVLDQLS